MQPSRVMRRALQVLATGLSIVACVLVAPVMAGAAESVKIGTVIWIGYGPYYVADALDLYKKSGLKVTLQVFSDPALIPPAIEGGTVDGGMLTYDQVIGVVAKGSTQRVVSPIDYSAGGDAIVSSVDIKKVADFKGKKIGFNPLSPSDFLLSYALKTNKLTEKDIEPVNMTPEAIPAAMASGAMPIGVTYEPSVSQITALEGGKKFHVVYSSKDAPGLITDVMVFKKEVIKAKPEVVKALIQGYIDGLDYMKKNPDKAAAIIGKALGVSGAEVKEQLSGVYNMTPGEFSKVFAKDSKETTSLYVSGALISEILKAKGQITTAPKTEDTFDDSILKTMLKK
ncbi:MAG TPA: ABC transporter substrate-binding protein [Burkholderiales bacterium]|nr:ABC transporter substrate-binding protein [Burkholderiales bacterium]